MCIKGEKVAAVCLVIKNAHFGPESDVLICTFAAKIAAVDVSLRRHLGPLPEDTFKLRDCALFFNDLTGA